MDLMDLASLLISLAALFSFINHRYIRLPTSIGIMLIALVFSLGMLLFEYLGWSTAKHAHRLLGSVDFDETLLHGMLSFLLFAGALHVNLGDLARQKRIIGILATLGVAISTLIVGLLTWLILHGLGFELSLLYCLLFGALISPTDPIAVLGILKATSAPKSLETKIVGESLFNDGIGVVLFIVLLGLATGQQELSGASVALMVLKEAVGGIVLGLLIGIAGYWMLARSDSYQVEVLITLGVAMGGYSLAGAIHTSGPIAVVVAGLLIGNHGRLLAMSTDSVEHLDTFWELLDEILNAVLFMLIGLEVLILSISGEYLLAGALVIPAVLFARWVCVGVPVRILSRFREFSPNSITIMTWGGLRGGISIALALSIPAGPERDVILFITYSVVVFSVLGQGLTIKHLVR
jgi:CPA1 family monovalent cation:H+ antiporter